MALFLAVFLAVVDHLVDSLVLQCRIEGLRSGVRPAHPGSSHRGASAVSLQVPGGGVLAAAARGRWRRVLAAGLRGLAGPGSARAVCTASGLTSASADSGWSLSDSTLIAQEQCSFHHCLRSTKHLRPGPGVFLVWFALVVGAADGVGAQEGEGGVEQGSFESLAAGVETCSPRMLARMEVPGLPVTGDGPGAGGRVGGGGGPARCLGQECCGGRGPGAGRGWWGPGEGGSARQGAGPGRGARPAGRAGRWAGRRRRRRCR